MEPLCGHAMRSLLSYMKVHVMEYGNRFYIETKVGSEQGLAKYTAVVLGNDTYF